MFPVSGYFEAIVLLLPREAGGRSAAIAPREGNYRPFARLSDGPMLRLRFIEGPPLVAPGDAARVVVEMEAEYDITPGAELDLFEHDAKTGVITVARVWRSSAALAG